MECARTCVYVTGCSRSLKKKKQRRTHRTAWNPLGACEQRRRVRERGERVREQQRGRASLLCAAARVIMVLARPSPRAPEHPRPGERILIFKQQWLELVLSGQKTLEVRGAKYRPGKCYFGTGGSTIENKWKHVWGDGRRDLCPGPSRACFAR